ncbi:amidohydrolase family protein [Acuticoccus sp. I52.16.1]|uniref:metal-dependent hydrolase family protein n=1 Tax=Acuticoccus sp. I52.16.1 TaxID=2928472 RepID=UPI001FD28063|nr:amidohydrolase family protein [Acuticoccus sp. I52.16.1]UOM32719.1 amidohydrolase family protein [Acuticoccus sp. I52.16.1]
MGQILFKNFAMLDPTKDDILPGHELLVEDKLIREVSDKPITAPNATVVDCAGGTLMPGLIDCHVHVMLAEVFISRLETMPLTLMTANAMAALRGMLDRGFTTVRDTGGADWGIKAAVDQGYCAGPRLFIAGRALGPTGGHSDMRRRTDPGALCPCCNALAFVMGVADGKTEVRKAVREEMRQGCDHVKIMMSGGVASPFDPLDSMQFSVGEVAAAVEEANAFGRYTCAHAYSPEAITRAAHAGVRTIEHGNLIDDASAKLMAEKDMFLVANLVAYYAMKEKASEYGMSGEMLEKNDLVIEGGLKSLEICKKAGVPVAYGSDLLGQLQVDQSREFELRSNVVPALDIVRSATTIAAKVLRQDGKLGCLAPGAFADLLVIDGDPLKDLSLFGGQGQHMSVIMKDGAFHKRTLH